jgi:cobalt-zinc-cadmium resistance protein CzcA
MASNVAIVGLIPAALSNDIGAQNQKPFAIAIIGALLVGAAFSIFLIPVLFNLLILKEKNNAK